MSPFAGVIAAVIAAVLAVAMAGCSRAADRWASRTGADSSAAPTSAGAATRVVTVDPWDRGGLAEGYSVAGESSGMCVPSGTSSRADAFRCFDDRDQVFDPCLAGRYADPVTRVACPVTARKVHVVRVDGGVERPPGGARPEQGDFWMATLEDGTRCRSSTGAGPPPREGFEVRMYCHDATLWGPFESATPLWTVRRTKGDTGPFTTTAVKEVFR